jgi:hypothetical protein
MGLRDGAGCVAERLSRVTRCPAGYRLEAYATWLSVYNAAPYREARSIRLKEYGKKRFSGTRLTSEKVIKMMLIPAKVLKVHKLYNEYLVSVQVGRDNFAGKFDGLQFGENKPRFGWYRCGRLDLVFVHDPCLDAGQEFPLWTIG